MTRSPAGMHDMLTAHDPFSRYRGVSSWPALLREAIASAINQDALIPMEDVVVDNETDPEMAAQVDEIVREFGAPNLRLFRNEQNLGMFGNWNRCVELARGQWLTILNDDDLLMPEFIRTAWAARQGRALVGVSVEYFGSARRAAGFVEVAFNRLHELVRTLTFFREGVRHLSVADVLRNNPVSASLGVLFNREVSIELGGYNEDFWPASDYVFNTNYWNANGGVLPAKKLARYRWQDNASLCAETLESMVTVAYALRRALIDRVSVSPLGRRILERLMAMEARVRANVFRRIDGRFERDRVLGKLGLAPINPAAERLYRVFLLYGWHFVAAAFRAKLLKAGVHRSNDAGGGGAMSDLTSTTPTLQKSGTEKESDV